MTLQPSVPRLLDTPSFAAQNPNMNRHAKAATVGGKDNPWELHDLYDAKSGVTYPESLAILPFSTSGYSEDSTLARNGHVSRVEVTSLVSHDDGLLPVHPGGGAASLVLDTSSWGALKPCSKPDCPCMDPGRKVVIKNDKGGAWGAQVQAAVEHAQKRERDHVQNVE